MLTERFIRDVAYRLSDLGDMPLGSRRDYSIRWGVDEAAAGRTLNRFVKDGLAGCVLRGNTRRKQQRYWMEPKGAKLAYDDSHVHTSLDELRRISDLHSAGADQAELDVMIGRFAWDHTHGPFGDYADHQHAPWTATVAGIREIFARLPLAEEVYPIAPRLLHSPNVIEPWELPPKIRVPGLTKLRWLRSGRLYHIVAQYGDDWWVTFSYVGLHAKATVLRDKHDGRFNGLARYEWSPGGQAPNDYQYEDDSCEPRPSLSVAVCADRWAEALMQEHLGLGMTPSRLWKGDPGCLPVQIEWQRSLLTDRLRSEIAGLQDPNARNGIHSWLESRSDLAAIDCVPAFRAVMVVSEFSGVNREELQEMIGASGLVFWNIVSSLCGAGVLLEDQREFYLDERGIRFVANVSRINESVIRHTFGRFLNKAHRERERCHNRGLAKLALAFFRAGGKLAGGWRATDNSPGVTQVQPDGIINLAVGPYGPGWYRVEFERTAVTPRRMAAKLGPYRRIAETGRPMPVLFVCERDIAVRRVLDGGAGLPIAATTLTAATDGPIDRSGIWRTHDGETQIGCKVG